MSNKFFNDLKYGLKETIKYKKKQKRIETEYNWIMLSEFFILLEQLDQKDRDKVIDRFFTFVSHELSAHGRDLPHDTE